MVLVTFIIVILRYAFDIGAIWLQESVIWMHGMVFMLGAAYTLRMDHCVGSIEAGKFADFAVLDADPYEVPPEALKDVPVHATVLGGRVFAVPPA